MTRAYFITGTDTDVGKTLVATTLLHKATAAGLSTLGLKPVAAGGRIRDGILANEDAWQLRELSSVRPSYADVNPVSLREAIAPHIAARHEGRELDVDALAEHCRKHAEISEFCVVEGAGGWCVPLTANETTEDLAVRIGFPVILVVGIRLGCINHALLTASAIATSGLAIAGWVANELAPDMPAVDENIAALKERLAAPMLGRIPWFTEITLATAGRYLSMESLK